MAHNRPRAGDPCVRPDGHTGQCYSQELAAYYRGYSKQWNRERGRYASQRYRNRNPVQRALTVTKQASKARAHD
jgi:hypothetical protein